MPDDNSQLLNSLIGMLGENPEEKINAVLSSLTGNSSQTQLENETENHSDDAEQKSSEAIPDLSFLMKIQGLLSQMGGGNDDRSRLLIALKPFLGTKRKPHVDRALQLLKLAKMAETAKEMDLFKDLKETKF